MQNSAEDRGLRTRSRRVLSWQGKKLLAGEQISKMDRPYAILGWRSSASGRGKLRSGQAEPKEGDGEKMNVGKGRKEWRHFAEVDREREGDGDHTKRGDDKSG